VYVPDGVTLENVTLDRPLVAQGEDLRLNNLHAPEGVVFQFLEDPPVDSTGIMLSPITPDPENVLDLTEIGKWQRPLMVNRDGSANAPPAIWEGAGPVVKPGLIFPSPAADKVPLTVRGKLDQSANLQEWQDDEEAVLFAIQSDGNIGSKNVEQTAPPGDPDWRLPIYDEGGNQIGWIPIHPVEE
jgi:hypothetical protein